MEYLVSKKTIDEAVEVRESMIKFLKEVVYPKLNKEKKEKVDELLLKGIQIDGAMSMCGIKIILN